MRALRTWIRGLVLAGALATLVAGVQAADVATEVSELAAAIASRLDGGVSGKEARQLAKVAKKLGKVSGVDIDAKDLRDALTGTYSSKTADADVLAEAQDVLDCLRALVAERLAAAEAIGAQLDDASLAKLQKKLGAAQKKVDAGEALVPGDPKKGSQLLYVGWVKLDKANRYAQKLLDRLNRIGNALEINAVLDGEGLHRTFRAKATPFIDFGQIIVQGCVGAIGNGPCREVLVVSFFYPEDSTQLGGVPALEVTYNDSSDFQGGTGPGVQDLYWGSTSPSVTILESSGKHVKGRFIAVMTSFDGTPPEIHVTGTFAIRR